jgi:hypothetical protein
MDEEKIKMAIEAGMTQWAAQLPFKLISMMGLPPALIAQHQAATAATAAAAAAKADAENQSSNQTTSSIDQV